MEEDDDDRLPVSAECEFTYGCYLRTGPLSGDVGYVTSDVAIGMSWEEWEKKRR